MKATMYVRYATRSLKRGGQHSILAILCIAIGVLVIVALQLVGVMIDASLSGNIRAINGGDIAVHSESHDLVTSQFAIFERLKSAGAITAWTAQVSDDATVYAATGAHRFGVDVVDPSVFPLGGSLPVLTPPDQSISGLLTGNNVVVCDVLLRSLGLKVGDTFSLETESGRSGDVHIAGVVPTSGVLTGSPDLLISQSSYDRLNNLSGAPDDYTWVWVDVPGHTDAASNDVAARIRQDLPLVTTRTVRQQESQLNNQIDVLRHFLQIIGLLALLIGGVGIVNTMQVLLRRRLLELAVLKTLGYHRRDICLMFGIETALLGLIGGVIGAVAGIGMSDIVKSLIERALFLNLGTHVDPWIVASGVLIGVVTAVIFGLLPIVQASEVRPMAILRGTTEGAALRSRLSTGLLLIPVLLLFFLLSLAILRNALLAAAVVIGAALLLGALTATFSGLAWLLSRFPVVDRFRGGYLVLLALLALLALGGIWLAPPVGMALLVLTFGALIVPLLSRNSRARLSLALRNIGRAKTRSASTLLAIFIGIFAIGLGLALGHSAKGTIAQLAATHAQQNAAIFASAADSDAVARQLQSVSNVTHEERISSVPVQIVGAAQPDVSLSGLAGFQLAGGDLPPITLEQGLGDEKKGRNLTATDAGTNNALAPLSDSETPLGLKLGDQIDVKAVGSTKSQWLTVVGFYTGGPSIAGVAPILVDDGLVQTVSSGQPYMAYLFHLDPNRVDPTLASIKTAVPGIVTISLGGILQNVDAFIDNLISLVETVAALALAAGLILTADTVGLSMLERRREIGILKAIGHTSWSVLSLVLVEILVIALCGASLGLFSVTLIANLLGRLAYSNWSQGGISVPQELGLMLAAILISLLVTVAVAWRATRLRPLEVLRNE